MFSAIQVDDLHVRYRQRRGQAIEAVSGLSFAVEPGEVVGFLGPNGAGKSSTLKALMGFVEPDRGTCSIFGATAGSRVARSLIGYLPEVGLYYPYLTPSETLRLYGELQGLSGRTLREQTAELLLAVGLEHAAGKQNRHLSKGMLQRVGIAQSLLGSPKLLILDEFTSGLDPVGRRHVRELLHERRRQGTTIFFSSHELAEVEMLCDRILLVHRGRLVEEQAVPRLKERLARYVLTFRGPASMVGLTDDLDALDNGAVRARFSDKPKLMEAMDRVRSAGGTTLDVVAEEGSLEDYFVDRIAQAA
jgi:ABC-2 type transport system ATP-binding protein